VPVFRMRLYKPRSCLQYKVWHNKDPSLLKGPECRDRPKFAALSTAMVTATR
jgi:hypothetical protein